MIKTFIQTHKYLPPIKWIGDDTKEFFSILRDMIKKFPSERFVYKITEHTLLESVNSTMIDTEVMKNWEEVFSSTLDYNWIQWCKDNHIPKNPLYRLKE